MQGRILLWLAVVLAVASCSSANRDSNGAPALAGLYKLGKPYKINGRWYYPEYDPGYDRIGTASWYGDAFDGRPTANGEVFDKDQVSAAHTTMPLPSIVRVTNLDNGRSMDVRVNDRGPFVGDRLIDLSEEAARQLGFHRQGLARVRVTFVKLAPAQGTPPTPVETSQPVMVAEAKPLKPTTGSTELDEGLAQGARKASRVQLAAVDGGFDRRVASVLPVSATGNQMSSCSLGPQFVQVGAFSDPGRAEAAVHAVEALDTVRLDPVFVGGRAAARVRIGPIAGGNRAIVLLDRVRGLGYSDAFLVTATADGGGISC